MGLEETGGEGVLGEREVAELETLGAIGKQGGWRPGYKLGTQPLKMGSSGDHFKLGIKS